MSTWKLNYTIAPPVFQGLQLRDILSKNPMLRSEHYRYVAAVGRGRLHSVATTDLRRGTMRQR